MNTDTICALATPDGVGGIGIVRISGDDAETIVSQMFDKNAAEFEDRKMYLGELKAEGFCDKCLAVIFRAPHSYTGETVAEIHCHGGRALMRGVLRAVLSHGARLAASGEFTKRAFLNGKLSLAESEGVVDMINAESTAELCAAYGELSGRLTDEVREIQNEITDIMSGIEVAIDYPDEEVDFADVTDKLAAVAERLRSAEDSFTVGRSIRSGINVSVIGVPNVGKSSLMNALLKYDRAIVTEIAGTTRDAITESLEIDGVKFNITDTAGIRESADIVEKIGVEKSREMIKRADLVLYVTDDAERVFTGVSEMVREDDGKPIICVINKCDLVGFKAKNHVKSSRYTVVSVSAKTGEGIDELKKIMAETVKMKNISGRGVILMSERHFNAIKRARILCEQSAAEQADMLDIAALHLKNIWDALGEITGSTATEDIIDNIFSKFCLGK